MNINIYNPYVREELYLMHHGIAGQKWGKRNGPPYPLSAGAHSASEKKAGWRKSLSDRSDDHKYAKAVKKEIKLLKKEHKILRKEGQNDNWRSALNKTLKQENKRHALEDKIGRERADKVNNKLRAKRDKSIKAAIKRKLDSITPEQKAKAKKIAIKALKIAGAIAITAAAVYAGVKLDKAIYGKLSKNYSKAVTDTVYWKHVYKSGLDQDKIARGIYNYGIDSGINRGKVPFQQMQLAGLKAGNAKVALDAYKRITRRK